MPQLSGHHEAPVELGAMTVLAAPRASTGKPPKRWELAWDSAAGTLSLGDGSYRDFGAVELPLG
jgi:hypothetical protein